MVRPLTSFNITPFLRSHGSGPRGRGSYAFQFEALGTTSEVFFAPVGTYDEARKWARQRAARWLVENDAPVSTPVYIDVLP